MGLSSQAQELPKDLVMGEILTRLPVKSLMRFKCVSKLWLWLICSKYFTTRFLTVPSPHLYMCLSDLRNYRNSVILTSAPSITSTTPSFVVDHDLTIRQRGDVIYQNLRGFMCYVYWRYPRMYNPATRQLVTLPGITSNHIILPPRAEQHYNYYFGYDPFNNQYKVISLINVYIRKPMQLIISEPWVFVVQKGGGGSWKKAALTPPDFCPHLPNYGQCINGVIYYLAWIDKHRSVVVSFNIRSEEFNMIQVPCRDGDKKRDTIKYVTLVENGGKATLFDHTNLRVNGVVVLWAVEDVKSKDWSCKSLLLQSSQQHLVNSITFKVICTTQGGKVLLVPTDLISPFHVISYDLQSNDMRKIEIKGIPDNWFSMDKDTISFDVMFMDQSDSLIYLET